MQKKTIKLNSFFCFFGLDLFGLFGSSRALPPRRDTMASKWNGRKAVQTPVAMPAGCEAARLRSEFIPTSD